MKAREADRVGALRMVLSELQKSVEGGRRRRARRPAPRAQAPAGVGDGVSRRRPRRAGRERGGRGEAHRGLPARRDGRGRAARDRPRVDRRDRRVVAEGSRPGHEGDDGQGRTASRRQARVGTRTRGAGCVARSSSPTRWRPSLRARGDSVLRALEGHVECELFLRGNVVTLDGEPAAVNAAQTVIRELAELIEQGHDIAPGTIAAVTAALDQHASPAAILEDVVWRHRSKQIAPKTVNQKRYVDSIRRNTVTFGIGPAGTGKTFLAVALAAAALCAATSTASSSRAPRSRPASASASCRATSWRRSTPTCARCSTRCTTCSRRRRSRRSSSAGRSRSRRWRSCAAGRSRSTARFSLRRAGGRSANCASATSSWAQTGDPHLFWAYSRRVGAMCTAFKHRTGRRRCAVRSTCGLCARLRTGGAARAARCVPTQ